MAFNALLIHEVTVSTPTSTGTENRYGDLISSTVQTVERVRVQPAPTGGGDVSEEDVVNRDLRITRFLIFASADTTINGLSTLTWGSRTLRVDGEPRPFYGRSSLHHYEIDAEEVLGG